MFWRKRKREPRPSFEEFLEEQIMWDQAVTMEDVLARYIDRYNLIISKSFDEPLRVSAARTRLKILEESVFTNPKLCRPDPKFDEYVEALRSIVRMADELDHDFLAAMKARERKR